MPNKRAGPHGSFGSDLDQLVRKFQQDPAKGRSKAGESDKNKPDRHINERLFEKAWRRDRDV